MLKFGSRSWGSDGTWYGWVIVLGVAAGVLWVSVGVLRGPGEEWERRGAPAMAWTGDTLFVYGGSPVPSTGESIRTVEPLNDAALIDPDSSEIDRLPAPPFDRPLRAVPAAVTVDDEVVVIGQLCREADGDDRACAAGPYRAAAYSLGDDDWREVELPGHLKQVLNGQSEGLGATSDGRAVFLLGGRGGFGTVASRELWTYAPGDEAWERLPDPGSLIEGACLAGDSVVVGSGLLPEAGAGGTPEAPAPAVPATPPVVTGPATGQATGPRLSVLRLDGEGRVWFPTRRAGVVPTGDQAGITCGEDLVLFDGGSDALRVFDFGPDGGWRRPTPKPGDDAHSSRLWTGEEFLFLDSNSPTLGYDPAADTWRGIERSAPTGLRSLWTGDSVVGWPGRTDVPVEFEVGDES